MPKNSILTHEVMQEELIEFLKNYEDEDWRSKKIESMSLPMCKALLSYTNIFMEEISKLSKPYYEVDAIARLKSLGYNFEHDFSAGFYENGHMRKWDVLGGDARHEEIVHDFTEIKEQITRLKFEILQQKEFLEKGNEIKVAISTISGDDLSEANKLTLEALDRNTRLSEQLKIKDQLIAEHTQQAKQFVAKSYLLEKRVADFSAQYQTMDDTLRKLSDHFTKLSEELAKKQLYICSMEKSIEAFTADSITKNEMINKITRESGVMKDRLDKLAMSLKENKQEKKPKLKMFGR